MTDNEIGKLDDEFMSPTSKPRKQYVRKVETIAKPCTAKLNPGWQLPSKKQDGTLEEVASNNPSANKTRKMLHQLECGVQIGMLGVATARGAPIKKCDYQRLLRKWNDKYLFSIYDCARAGMRKKEIAMVLGFSHNDFSLLCRRSKAVRVAIYHGRNEVQKLKNKSSALEYVHEHLHPDIQQEWNELHQAWKNNDYNAKDKLFAMLDIKGTKYRQILFLQAYIVTRFNVSSAMAIVGVSQSTVDNWKTKPTFQKLWNEIITHRNAYFENKLFDLVDMGDSKATLFVNERLNRETYGKEIKVSANVESALPVQKNEIDVTMLSLELQEQIYNELRQKQLLIGQQPDVNAHGKVIDV